MRGVGAVAFFLAVFVAPGPAGAGECSGNPNAIGTSRTIVVDPSEHSLLGSVQYQETLPLQDKEVVLTFDDGPLPPYSTRILDILAKECVKATYFMVGKMVRAFPKVVRRTFEEGHTIANHSQNHSYAIHRQPIVDAWREIDDGFESLRTALGDPAAVAPFFRFPGLLREASVERFLAARKIMSWSVDVISDDSRRVGSAEIIRRTISRLEAKGKGIVLLHDIQPATANALPELLRQLKARGFRIVHVVPTGPGRVKTPTTPEQWAVARPPRPDDGIWHKAVVTKARAVRPVLDAPGLDSLGTGGANESVVLAAFGPRTDAPPDDGDDFLLPIIKTPIAKMWPGGLPAMELAEADQALPAPALENFRYVRLGTQRAKRKIDRRLVAKKGEEWTAARAEPKAAPKSNRAAPKAHGERTASKNAGKASTSGSKTGRTRATGHQIQLPRPQASLSK
jgi:peptidoglycan/xylan/chitin deacetylase (PgdA/CDA1 family)